MDAAKECAVCKETKPLTEFYLEKGRRVRDCRICRVKRVGEYQKTAAGKATMRRAQDKHRYGLEAGGYERMFEAQAGCCGICGSRESRNPRSARFSIDHCHRTGRVRGLLCLPCNSHLGWHETYMNEIDKWLEEK